MVGTKPLVILNSWPLIKEAMAKKELAGRPSIFSGTFFQKGKTGELKNIHWERLIALSSKSDTNLKNRCNYFSNRYLYYGRKDMGTTSGVLSSANEKLFG